MIDPPKSKWAPTQQPNRTVTPGQMRSDREEIPEGFNKADADRAETMEAQLVTEIRPLATAGCQVYWPAPYEVCGVIRDKYNSMGGPNSFLLWPKTNELTNPDGVGKRTEFQNGPIYWSPQGGAHPVVNHFLAAWARHDYEAGYIGYPTTDEIVNPDGVGRRQEFTGAAIYWRLNEAYSIGGEIRNKWNSTGAEQGPLGYPTSDESLVAKNNGRYNDFENGTITWSIPTGARLLYGLIANRWTQLGREDGSFGLPKSDESVTPDGIGHFAEFENDYTIWSTALTGAFEVSPAIAAAWNQNGGPSGAMGFPIDSPLEETADMLTGQRFQYGSIRYADENNVYAALNGPVLPNTPAPSNQAAALDESQGKDPATHDPATLDRHPDITTNQELAPRDITGQAYNPHFPEWNPMLIRRGWWSDQNPDDGWGMDKAGFKHQLHDLDAILYTLESRFRGQRIDNQPGSRYTAQAQHHFCELTWEGEVCEIVEWRNVHAVYDPRYFETYWQNEVEGIVGLVTAYCGPDGNTALTGTETCDSWIGPALASEYSN